MLEEGLDVCFRGKKGVPNQLESPQVVELGDREGIVEEKGGVLVALNVLDPGLAPDGPPALDLDLLHLFVGVEREVVLEVTRGHPRAEVASFGSG